MTIHSKFTKQWGKNPSIRHIGGRAYHFQESHRSKHGAEEAVEHYRNQGRLARMFKLFVPAHPLKGRPEVIVPGITWYYIYVTVKLRGKKR